MYCLLFYDNEPRWWCNSKRARLECGISLVRVPVGLGQTKGHKTSICCFSAMQAVFMCKRKDWLARNQNNVLFH